MFSFAGDGQTEDILALTCPSAGQPVRLNVYVYDHDWHMLDMWEWETSIGSAGIQFYPHTITPSDIQFSTNITENMCASQNRTKNRGVFILKSPIVPIPGHVMWVHAHLEYNDGMTDAFTLLPLSCLGSTTNKYTAITYCEANGVCLIAIAAFQLTTVEITLPSREDVTVYISDTKYKGTENGFISLKLNRLESIQIECACDLTGTVIQSNKKIAVFAGSKDVSVGFHGTKNVLFEQMIPQDKWSKEYAFACHDVCSSAGAFVRIVVAYVDTTVEATGFPSIKVPHLHNYLQHWIRKDAFIFIKSDKDINVAVILLNEPSENLAPSMFILPQNDVVITEEFFIPTSSGSSQGIVRGIGRPPDHTTSPTDDYLFLMPSLYLYKFIYAPTTISPINNLAAFWIVETKGTYRRSRSSMICNTVSNKLT